MTFSSVSILLYELIYGSALLPQLCVRVGFFTDRTVPVGVSPWHDEVLVSRLGEISGRFKGPPSVAEVPILQGVGVSKSYCLRIVPEAPTAYAREMLWVFTPNRAFVMPLGWADQDPPL